MRAAGAIAALNKVLSCDVAACAAGGKIGASPTAVSARASIVDE
jgi:hypothetical protein